MKLGKKEINLLIGLLGVIIVVATWMIVVKPMKEKTTALENANIALKEQADEYQAINAQRTKFEEDSVRLIDERAGLLANFASGMTKEDEIMYWANMERANSATLAMSNLSMAGWEEVVVSAPSEGQNGEGATQLHLYKAPVSYTYQSTYDGLKNMVSYVYAQNNKKSIENLIIGYDGTTGNLVGTIGINMYYMNGTDNEYVPATIPTVPTGVADVFDSVDKLVDTAGVSDYEAEESEEDSEE